MECSHVYLTAKLRPEYQQWFFKSMLYGAQKRCSRKNLENKKTCPRFILNTFSESQYVCSLRQIWDKLRIWKGQTMLKKSKFWYVKISSKLYGNHLQDPKKHQKTISIDFGVILDQNKILKKKSLQIF